MVEVIVSAVLVVVLATATLKVIDGNAAQAGTNENRTIASNLAHAELNRLRLMQIDALVDWLGKNPTRKQAVKQKTFTITSTARWASDQGTVSLDCASTDTTGARYVIINTSVTWPNMGTAKPISAATVVAPRTSGTDGFRGTLVFKVADVQGRPVPGVTVTPTMNGTSAPSLVTDDSGCVIFPRLTQGDWDVTFAKGAMIDKNRNSPGETTVSIAAGQKSIVNVALDDPIAIPVAVRDASTSAGAVWRSVTLTDGNTPLSQAASGTPATSTFSRLWPGPGGYAAYAGNCGGNDPARYVTDPATALPGSAWSLDPRPATAPTHYAYVRPLTLTVSTGSSATLTSASWRIEPDTANAVMTRAGEPACTETVPTGTSYSSLAGSGSSWSASTVLPFGIWNVCVQARWSGTTRYGLYKFNNFPDTGTLRAGLPARSPTSLSVTPTSTNSSTVSGC